MRYYELLYIVNPNIEDDKINAIIGQMGDEISKYKVSIINHHMYGKKRLAYQINNNKYGIYILLQFSAEEFEFLKEFERFLILDKTIIRHQVVKLDKEPAKVDKVDLTVEESDSSNKENIEADAPVEDAKAEDKPTAKDTKEPAKTDEEVLEVEDVKTEAVEVKEETDEKAVAEESDNDNKEEGE